MMNRRGGLGALLWGPLVGMAAVKATTGRVFGADAAAATVPGETSGDAPTTLPAPPQAEPARVKRCVRYSKNCDGQTRYFALPHWLAYIDDAEVTLKDRHGMRFYSVARGNLREETIFPYPEGGDFVYLSRLNQGIRFTRTPRAGQRISIFYTGSAAL